MKTSPLFHAYIIPHLSKKVKPFLGDKKNIWQQDQHAKMTGPSALVYHTLCKKSKGKMGKVGQDAFAQECRSSASRR